MSDKENNRRQIGKNYEVLRTIGKGGFGTVYLCEDRVTKLQCAVKEIQLPKSSSPSAKINPKEEIQIHRMLASKRSNRFVRIHDDFVCDGFVYLVMEYCKEGSLRDYVKKNGPMGVLLATDVLTQLCDALKLIHEEDIAHRDLTPNNVLISEIRRGRLSDEVKRIRVKVTDFGLSKKTPNNAQGQGQFKTTLGTGPFMAPEVKLGKYTKEADMFSLGSLFYFLLTKNYLPDQTAAKQQNVGGGGKQQLDLDPMMDKLRAQHSVRELEPAVQSDLERFLRKLLCSEKGRIRLDKIDVDPFITWFYTERYVIDPELRDLCSHSQSGAFGGGGGRRRSRSRSVDNKPQAAGAGAAAAYRHQQQLEVAALPKRPNRDSALGSDQQSRSGSSRCRHPHVDLDTGQCISCRFWVTTAINNGTTSRPKEPLASTSARRRIPFYDEMCVSEPIIGKPEQKFATDLTNHRRPTSSSQSQHNQQQQQKQHHKQQQPPPPPPLTVRTEPAAFGGVAGKKAHGHGNDGGTTTIYSQEVPPWPFPVVTHDYRANNAYGRCIFFRHLNPTTTTAAGGGGGGELQLVAVLEKTAVSPAEDQTVRRIFELWQNGVDQELRVFEPANPKAKLPAEKGARRIETGREIVPRIKSQQQYQRICRTGKEGGGGEEKKIKDGYEKMWAFLKLASSKIAQAYCEEIVEGGRRYRVELCLNGWAKAYVGSKETRADIAALKLCGQQKSEDSPFEQRNQKEVSLRRDELELLEELAKALRAHVRQSVWRSRRFDRRNIRCTDYTSGYR